MLVNLSEVFTNEGKVKKYPVQFGLEAFQHGAERYFVESAESFDLNVTNLGERKLFIEGNAVIKLRIPCARCLNDVIITCKLDLSREVDMKQTREERIEELDEQPYIEGYNLDADMLICNELNVNIPMRVLCDENCKGICNRCGTNLNSETCDCDITELDPRMSVIRDIFKKAGN